MLKKRIARVAWVLGMAALGACGDSTSAGGGGSGGTGEGAGADDGGGGSDQGGAGAGEVGGSGGEGGSGGAQGPEVTAVATFDPSLGELPEGLAMRDDVFVGFATTGQIDQFALPGLERSTFANAPPPPANVAFMTGLSFDAGGDLYAAYVSFSPDQTPGIYRAPAEGGAATLWAAHPQLNFPNGLAWDDAGALFVTESALGAIFKIDTDGTADLWLSDPALAGDLEACGPHGDLAVGANGILFDGDSFVVANSDQATLLRIPVEADGTAGAIETRVPQDCDNLAGLDGITFDDDGSIVGAVNRSNRLVRIGTGGEVTVLFEGAPLDFPASLEFTGTGADRTLYVTSFALAAAMSGGTPHPALVSVKF